jgi:hypothetical protein
MAWTTSKSSTGNYPLLNGAGQNPGDLNYNHQLFGYPPALPFENTSQYLTEDLFCDSFTRSAQPKLRPQMGPGGAELHRLNCYDTSHHSINFKEPRVSMAAGITDSNAIWPRSLPAMPSLSTGHISNEPQVGKHKVPRLSNQRENPE